jgi:hypothetical protein
MLVLEAPLLESTLPSMTTLLLTPNPATNHLPLLGDNRTEVDEAAMIWVTFLDPSPQQSATKITMISS